jgi:hypothetical protein
VVSHLLVALVPTAITTVTGVNSEKRKVET